MVDQSKLASTVSTDGPPGGSPDTSDGINTAGHSFGVNLSGLSRRAGSPIA